MDIRYYSYDTEIISDLSSGAIHLFDKNVDKEIARRIYRGDIFDSQPLFMNMSEFKGSLFLSDKITLKEEKQVIAFYKALSKDHKRRLKVEGYYDVIDIAANFFNFFKLLNEYRIEELTDLKEWQKNIYELFCDIKNNYLTLLDDKNYTDSVFIGAEENFVLDTYSSYKDKEITIYNKLYFTPREKWIIERLEDEGYRFILKLQVNKGDFCEESLQLKDVTYNSSGNLNVYRVEDEFTALLKVIEVTDKYEDKDYKIYDANNENFKYNNFFNKVTYLSEIPIFKLIECFHILINGLKTEDFIAIPKKIDKNTLDDTDALLSKKLLIDVSSLIEVIEIEEFKKYYSLTDEDISLIHYLVELGYKFIVRKEIENLLERLEDKDDNHHAKSFEKLFSIIDDLRDMYRITTLKEWCERLTFTKEVMEDFSTDGNNEIGKYFEALSEVEIIEELDLIDTDTDGNKLWNKFFNANISEGLLRLIMKYHRFKEVSKNQYKLKKTILSDMPSTSEGIRIFLNISDIFVPENKGSNFLLTEAQRKKLGIKNLDDDRILEKYNLLRGISTAKESYVIAIQNQGANTSLSPFVEEIIDSETIDEGVKLDTNNYLDLIKVGIKDGTFIDIPMNLEDTDLPLDKEELLEKENMSAYMCDELFNCQYKMYLRYVLRFAQKNLEVDEGLTRREYGNLAHDIFEEVLTVYIKDPKKYEPLQGHDIDSNKIYEIVEKLVNQDSRKLKLPYLNSKYYKDIIYRNLAEGVRRFFREISKILKYEIIKDIHVEKYGRRKISDGLSQSAKGDLIIETETTTHIIDFKTGNKIDRQLDYYGILYTGEADGARRYIYSIDKNILDEADKVVMTKDDLLDKVDELLDKTIYERNYTSKCNRCEYWVVCKEVEKNV